MTEFEKAAAADYPEMDFRKHEGEFEGQYLNSQTRWAWWGWCLAKGLPT